MAMKVFFSNQFRVKRKRGSVTDPDLNPLIHGKKTLTFPHTPPGLESLYTLERVYFFKRMEMFEDDVFNEYKGEFIDTKGNRIFIITSAAHHTSEEVIHYGKFKPVKFKGKVNYGALNYAGIQVFEIHGEPEKIIRIGPSSGTWGEIQVMPGAAWNRFRLTTLKCCCIKVKKKELTEAEIRVVVIKRDLRAARCKIGNRGNAQTGQVYKNVYTLRGKVLGGTCRQQNPHNLLYKKTFDLKIYVHDPLKMEEHKVTTDEEDDIEEEESDEDDSEEEEEEEATQNVGTPEVVTPRRSHKKGSRGSKDEEPRDSKNEGLRGSKNEGLRGSKNGGSRGSKDEGPRGSKNRGSRGSKDEGPRGSKNRGSRGSKDEGPRGSKNKGSRGSKDEDLRDSKNEGLRGSKNGGPRGFNNEGLLTSNNNEEPRRSHNTGPRSSLNEGPRRSQNEEPAPSQREETIPAPKEGRASHEEASKRHSHRNSHKKSRPSAGLA